MRSIFCLVYVALLSFATADDDVDIFEATSVGPANSLLFTNNPGMDLLGRSMNPLDALAVGLLPRQGSRCPYPVMCSANTCCPANTKCCGTGIKCCPTNSNCISFPIEACCPYSAQTCGGRACAEPGSICCGSTVCPAGTVCNTNGGTSCCKPGEILCAGGCCPSGSQCSTPGYCQRFRISSIQQTISQARTASSVQSRASSFQVSTVVSTLAATSTANSCPIQKRATRRPGCSYECHNGVWHPVVEIPNIPGVTDQLHFSMCSGILNTGSAGRGGDGRNFDILKYAGDGQAAKALRRSKAKCARYCAKQKKVFKDKDSLQCDEYPPAMAEEGGTGAFRVCIPREQNSGQQGQRFADFVDKCAPAKGEKIVVRMKGGCNVRARSLPDELEPVYGPVIEKRQSTASNQSFDATGSGLQTVGDTKFIYVPFEDIQNGHYHVEADFSGSIDGISILDSDGDHWYNSTAKDQKTIDFDVDGIDPEDPLPVAMIVHVSNEVNVSYKATAAPASTTSKTPSSGARSMIGDGERWYTVMGMIPLLAIIFA